MIEGLPRLSPVRVTGKNGSRPLGITVYAAWRWSARMRGLLRRPMLDEDEGLLISPCGQVHTFGMNYALDLVYMDKRGVIVKCVAELKPNRISAAWGGWQVLELASGGLKRADLTPGERLSWTD